MRHRPEASLSTRLKHLDGHATPLPTPAFGIDDIVRGGRRRHRNRTTIRAAVTTLGVAAISATTITVFAIARPGDNTPAAGPPAVSAPASPPPAINLADNALTYRKTGNTVTISMMNTTAAATMTLTRATYTETSAHATFTIRSDHPLTVNTDQFVIHVDDGEVGIDKPRTSTLPPGTNTITIDATNTGSEPRGIGWIAGDGAQWIRP